MMLIVKAFLINQLRRGLGMLAATLVTYGCLKGTDVGAFVDIASGIAMGIVSLAWDWWRVKGEKELRDEIAYLKGKNAK